MALSFVAQYTIQCSNFAEFDKACTDLAANPAITNLERNDAALSCTFTLTATDTTAT